MGSRLGLPTVVLCVALAATGCQPQAASEDASSSDTALAQTTQEESGQLEPVELSCPDSEEYGLTAPGADTVVVDLTLDEDGQLTASEENLVVARGQALKWRSDTLRWRVAFLGEASPLAPMKDDVTGGPDGMAMPEGERAVIQAEPGCYYYVAAALHPETGDPLLLDPPIVVRDRE